MASDKGFEWCDRTLVRSPYHYALCTSEKGFHKILKNIKLPKSEWPEFTTEDIGACVHTFEYNRVMIAVVVMEKSKSHIDSVYPKLTHEAVHIFQHIKDFIGESKPSVEFEAYSIQSIAQNLMESYNRQTTKKPKKGK